MITSQWRLSLLGGCVLLLALVIPYLFPQWDVYAAQFLQTHLLFIGALLLTLLFLLLWKYPQQQVAAVRDRKDRIDLESKSRQTLAQIVGGAVLLVGLYFTAQTLRTTQEGQITDRFTKAITQLGDNNIAVRLGGIYALERIARDSESDHWAVMEVMEVLTAFVREQGPAKTVPPDQTSGERAIKEGPPEQKSPADIQAVLTVIRRRTRTYRNGETERLDLRNTTLQGADLRNAKLQDAQLQGADLRDAQLKGANLGNAQLQGADLRDVQLQDVNLWNAKLQGADLRDAQLKNAQLKNAQLKRAQLQGADLTAVANLTQAQINEACTNKNTKLPEGLTRPAPCPEMP